VDFHNAYEDSKMADAYSRLEFPGTYYLAFRDLPEILAKYVKGKQAMDFGCGAGRSTRFLVKLGFEAVGVDISEDMIKRAREIDPGGDYRLIGEGEFTPVSDRSFDLIQSAFTFDNIPTKDLKLKILREIARMLKPNGRFVNLVSDPEIYLHEWTSFSTKNFPENKHAKCGDIVKIINTDIDDSRPVDDIVWPDKDYREIYAEAGLEVVDMYKPLARIDEPYKWVNEIRIAPWVIYVLSAS
jgi:ubiquinone/menaquinone biosynthesis C-methylase UbiE